MTRHEHLKAKRAHPAVQRRLELVVQDMIDVAWVAGGCSLGEAPFHLGGRAAAEDLDGPLARLEQAWAVVGVEVGVHHGCRDLTQHR